MPTTAIQSTTAPSYVEFRQKVQCIVKDNRPISVQQAIELQEYQQSLAGKKVEDWQGWVSAVTPTRTDIEELKRTRDPSDVPDLHVWVAMEDPSATDRPHSTVMLFGISQDQVEGLRAWTDPLTADSPWQKIEFDGEILSVYFGDHIDILLSSIRTDLGE